MVRPIHGTTGTDAGESEPRVVLTLVGRDGGTIDGRPVPIPPGADRHLVLMAEACCVAAELGRPVRVIARDRHLEWELVAHPDGGVTAAGPGRPRVADPGARPVAPGLLAPGPVDAGPVDAEPVDAGPDPGPVDPRVRRVTGPGAVAGPAILELPRRRFERVRALRPPGLPVVGGLVAGALLLGSLAAVPSPGGGPSTPERVVTTVTATTSRAGTSPSSASTLRSPAPSSAGGPAGLAPSRRGRLAVAGPPGHQVEPAWSIPIAGWTRSVAADDGTVLSRDPDGRVLFVDPWTGAVRWRSATATTKGQDGPWLTSIDGSKAAAVVDRGLLSYWTLPGGSAAGRAIGVRLPDAAKVTWVGTAPLVTWEGGAGVIRGGVLRPVALPDRARALATDGSTVIAVVGATYLSQPVGGRAARPRKLPRPTGAGSRPVRIEAVGTAYLFVAWPRRTGGGQVVSLVDTRTGRAVVQTVIGTSLDVTHASVVREPAGTQTLVGSVLVDTYTANLNLLDPRYVVRVVTRGHAWAMFQGRATDIHLNRAGDFRTVPFPAGEPALPVGVVAASARGRATAVVVAAAEDGWALHGLPAKGSAS